MGGTGDWCRGGSGKTSGTWLPFPLGTKLSTFSWPAGEDRISSASSREKFSYKSQRLELVNNNVFSTSCVSRKFQQVSDLDQFLKIGDVFLIYFIFNFRQTQTHCRVPHLLKLFGLHSLFHFFLQFIYKLSVNRVY